MCNWRSASPSGSAPHTPTSPSPPAAPPPPSSLLPPPPQPSLPPLPSLHPLLLLLGWSLLLLSPSRWSFSHPAPFFFFSFFFFCRSLRRHKITEAVLTSLSGWPNTLPFSSLLPPAPLLLLHSRIHHTLAWDAQCYTLHTKKRKRKKEGKTKTQTIRQKKKKYIQVFPLQQTAHENKHFPASSTWQ